MKKIYLQPSISSLGTCKSLLSFFGRFVGVELSKMFLGERERSERPAGVNFWWPPRDLLPRNIKFIVVPKI